MSGLARSNSVSDSIKERRLRPIYELLDSGHNKKVIQEADRLLKKQSNFSCVKVLKALALLRMGKKDDCTSLVMQVFDEVPIDDNTIQAMAICFRELDKPELVCALMENACKKDKSEDLLTFAYMAHVRVMDFSKQHQTAMALYKTYPKIPYYSWAVMSLYVKALYDDPKLATVVTLPLAERMMAKFIEEGQINTEHEITLYSMILLKQKNYEKALKVLDEVSKSGGRWTTTLYSKMMITCLKETEKFDQLADYLETLILENVDDFKYYQMYVDSCGAIYKDRVAKFLKELVVKPYCAEVVSRAAVIAQLNHYHKLSKMQLDTSDMSIRDPLFIHLKRYIGKPFFLQEVKNFLKYLSSEQDQKDVIELAEKTLFENERRSHVMVHIQRKTNLECLRHYFQLTDILADQLKVIKSVGDFVRGYQNIRKELVLADFKLDHREIYPQEEYIIQASVTLIKTFWNQLKFWHGFYLNNDMKRCALQETTADSKAKETTSNVVGESGDEANSSDHVNGIDPVISSSEFTLSEEDFPILLNLALLEYGLDHSPCSSPLRLLLGKSYSFCGAIVAGNDQFMRLDIKHAQIESLGYLYLWKAMVCGVFTDAARVANHVDVFYNNHQKESMEHVISAYKYGSWEKILEFMRFREGIINSAQANALRVDKHLLEYMTDANSHESTVRISERKVVHYKTYLENSFQDARDFRIHEFIVDESVPSELIELTHKDLLERLKIRSIYLNIINNFVQATEHGSHELQFHTHLEFARQACQTLRDVILKNEYREFQDDYSKRCFFGPWPPTVHDYCGSGFFKFLFELFQVVHCAGQNNSSPAIAECLPILSNSLNETVDYFITNWSSINFLLINFSNLVEEVFHVMESLGFCCILADVLKCFINGGNSNDPRSKKRKAKESTPESQRFESLDTFIKTISTNLKKVEDRLWEFKFTTGNWYPTSWDKLEKMWSGKVSEEILTNVLPQSLPTVTDKLNASYYRAFAEMRLNASLKRKYADRLLDTSS